MQKLKLLVVEDRAVNLAHARAVMDKHKDRVDAVFAEDFATAERHLRTGGITGMLTDIFFPYAKGTGRIETRLFEDARLHCFTNEDFAAVDLLAKTLGEELREPLTMGTADLIEIDAQLSKRLCGILSSENCSDESMEALRSLRPLRTALMTLQYYRSGVPEWKRELDSLDADLKSGDESRQPCGILTMRIAYEMGIPFIAVSSLHAAHGSSASPVYNLLRSEGILTELQVIETGGYGHRGSTEESEQAGHIKDENVWMKALVGLLERIEKPDSTK
ncbi:MAG: hypothetical protein AABW86_04955 [Candidatus Micrarchaeota archaeon]